MASKLLALGLLYANVFRASANPFPVAWDQYEKAECQAVDNILSVIQVLQAPATSFCSSFLDIPYSTVLSAIQPPTAYSTTVAVSTTTSLVTTITTQPPQKRGLRAPIATPIELKLFASNLLSTACSCLSLEPSLTTSTTTLATPESIATITSTTTVISTVVSTTSSALQPFVTCSNPQQNADDYEYCPNAPANCGCAPRAGSGIGVCWGDYYPSRSCTIDADCSDGELCLGEFSEQGGEAYFCHDTQQCVGNVI